MPPRIRNIRTKEERFAPPFFSCWSAKAAIESRGRPTVIRVPRMMMPISRTEPPAVQRQTLISSHDGTLPGPFEFLLTTIASPGRFSHVSLSGVLVQVPCSAPRQTRAVNEGGHLKQDSEQNEGQLSAYLRSPTQPRAEKIPSEQADQSVASPTHSPGSWRSGCSEEGRKWPRCGWQ